jgi:hypothetical protein
MKNRKQRRMRLTEICNLAHAHGVTVVSPSTWPSDVLGEATVGVYSDHVTPLSRSLLRSGRRAQIVPLIVMRRRTPDFETPYSLEHTLAHELGHHIARWSDHFDERMGKTTVTPILDRLALNHGFDLHLVENRRELRAECLARRILGETLPPTLRRFSERAWRELQRRTA